MTRAARAVGVWWGSLWLRVSSRNFRSCGNIRDPVLVRTGVWVPDKGWRIFRDDNELAGLEMLGVSADASESWGPWQ